jgi:hypothetical protein
MPELLNQQVILEYGPRGSQRRRFQGTIRPDGIEIDGEVYSPSYSAVLCMQRAGSQRRTANGWVMWKTEQGEYLDALYTRARERQRAADHKPTAAGT